MDFFSDTQETAARFGDYIADLHDVFRCNGVDFGAPEDFFAFARTLKYHSELRGDLLRVVKSVMESGTDISFRTILTVIAVASGGPDVGTSDRKMSVPVTLLIESLIGVGSCSQLDAEHPGLYPDLTVKEREPAPALDRYSSGGEPTGDAREGTRETAGEEAVPILAGESSSSGVEAARCADVPGHGVEETFIEEARHDSSIDSPIESSTDEGLASSQSSLNGYGSSSSEGQGLFNDAGGSNTLSESLTRLELNGLQLKIYLDSIDQRISRMEPRLENVAPLALSTPPADAREGAGARFSAAIASEKGSVPLGNDAPVSNHQGRAATAISAASEPLAVPVTPGTHSGQSDSGKFNFGQFNFGQFNFGRRQVALPILVCVGLLLVASSLLWRSGRDTGAVVISPVSASMERGPNGGAASVAPGAVPSVGGLQAATGPQAAAGSVGAPSAAVRGAQRESSAPGFTREEVNRVADKPAPSPKKSAQIPLRSPLRSSSSAAVPLVAKDSAEVADSPDDAEESSSLRLSNRPVDVSPGVMAANLLSAPEPSYPKLASLTRMQGDVVMQAVISKEGSVEELRVIKGHRLLRGAAKKAVRNWRYRPYKIDGVPVEVATTVSVEFSLDH